MTDAPDAALSEPKGDTETSPPERGWYLYGITRSGAPAAEPAGDDVESDPEAGSLMDEPVEVLECGELAAVVQRVSLDDFSPQALEARADDIAWLEAMVREHNQVVATVHQRQAILPAKFASVYGGTEDLLAALDQAQDALIAQLERVEGCDEWAVHIYADRPAVEQRVAASHPVVRQLETELAAARPGRAYFLQRKLADELSAATSQALDELAQVVYDHLSRHAVAAQVNPPARTGSATEGDTEILRAAFLVQRAESDTFQSELDSFVAEHEGMRSECTGPWPPYSFADLEETPG